MKPSLIDEIYEYTGLIFSNKREKYFQKLIDKKIEEAIKALDEIVTTSSDTGMNFLNNPKEDIYTMKDGKSIETSGYSTETPKFGGYCPMCIIKGIHHKSGEDCPTDVLRPLTTGHDKAGITGNPGKMNNNPDYKLIKRLMTTMKEYGLPDFRDDTVAVDVLQIVKDHGYRKTN